MAALFFDTSALVRRYDRTEAGSTRVRALCRESAGHVLFAARLAPLEMASALNRKLRGGMLDEARRDRHWQLFRAHWRSQYRTIALDEPALRRAERLLFAYPLRAYDALQLASALRAATLIAGLIPAFWFCTADRVQARAAEQEGVTVELIA